MIYPTLLSFDSGSSNLPISNSRSSSSYTSSSSSSSHYSTTRNNPSLNWRDSYFSLIHDNVDLDSSIRPITSNIIFNKNYSHDATINQYTLIESIGHGQFGKVYKAKSLTSNSLVVAIKNICKKPYNSIYTMNQIIRHINKWKITNPRKNITADETVMILNLQKCKREIFILNKLSKAAIKSNNNIVKIIEVLDSPISKSIWIVTEFCNLGELQWKRDNKDQILKQWTYLYPNNSQNIFSFAKKALHDLTMGLNFLKKNGCIHRDIKPSNILADAVNKKLKISDFGCSLLLPQELDIEQSYLPELKTCFKNEINKIVGTPAFIPPELCHFTSIAESELNSDDADIDGFKIDMWSLGITMYCIIFNDLPFIGNNEFITYQKIVNDKIEYPIFSDINHERSHLLKLIVDCMLEKNPDRRINVETLSKEIVKLQTNKEEITNSDIRTNLIREDSVQRNTSEKNVLPSNNSSFFDKFHELGLTNTEPSFNNSIGVDSSSIFQTGKYFPDNSNFSTLHQFGNIDLNSPNAFSFVTTDSDTSSFDEPVQILNFLDSYDQPDTPVDPQISGQPSNKNNDLVTKQQDGLQEKKHNTIITTTSARRTGLSPSADVIDFKKFLAENMHNPSP